VRPIPNIRFGDRPPALCDERRRIFARPGPDEERTGLFVNIVGEVARDLPPQGPVDPQIDLTGDHRTGEATPGLPGRVVAEPDPKGR